MGVAGEAHQSTSGVVFDPIGSSRVNNDEITVFNIAANIVVKTLKDGHLW